MERLAIGIDLDGVICDSASLIIPKLFARFRPGYQPAKKERFGFDLGGHVSELNTTQEELLTFVENILIEVEFHQTVKPVEGALEGIQKFYEQGHRLYVLSNRPETVDLGKRFDAQDLTFSWLKRHQIAPLVTSLILNPDHFDRDFKVRKACELGLDVLVEDEPDEAMKFVEAGKKVVLFDCQRKQYSVHQDLICANSWKEVVAACEMFA